MLLTKQQFITILNIIKDLMDEQDKTASAFNELFDDCHQPIMKLGNATITKLVDFLQANTNPEGEDISWFVWDCDMGKSGSCKWSFLLEDGTEKTFVCKTPAKFYDSLVYFNKM